MWGTEPSEPIPLPERPSSGQRDDAGEHDELGLPTHGGGAQREAERVADPHAQRADAVDPPGVRADGVLDLVRLARAQRGKDEAGAVTERVVDRLLRHDHRRRGRLACCGCAP